MVSAKVTVVPNGAAANSQRSAECALLDVADNFLDKSLTVIITPAQGSTTADETLSLATDVTLAAANTIRLVCIVGSGTFVASNPRLTAVQVGTLSRRQADEPRLRAGA